MLRSLKSVFFAVAAVVGLMFGFASSAHAALSTAITDAITAAQTDLLALYAALTAAGVVIWVAVLIYRHFRVR